MKTITVRNVNQGLEDALWWLRHDGVLCDSRNGRVLRAQTPVATTYLRPQERVLFSNLRDANPFFHLMESIWMLAGRNDVEFPAAYAKQIAEYSDDGATLHGAYGYRWRKYFGYDQLLRILNLLRGDQETRRAVLTMWSPQDLARTGKDLPCNTHAYFDASLGRLDMTVCNRSNDAVWGCYGANAVHFSILHEFVAAAAGVPLGAYTQFSNNLHVYIDRPDVRRLFLFDKTEQHICGVRYQPLDMYLLNDMLPQPLLCTGEKWEDFLADAQRFTLSGAAERSLRTAFFQGVVVPMQLAHEAYQNGEWDRALAALEDCTADDWCIAARGWLRKRMEKRGVQC